MKAPSDLHRSHGSFMRRPWDFHGTSMEFLWHSKLLWDSSGNSTGLPWYFHETYVVFHGISMLFTWKEGILMGIPWDIHGTTKAVPYNYMGIPWDLHGIPMGAPWDFNGTHPYQTTKYAHSGCHGTFPQQLDLWVFLSSAFLWKSIETH